ncbi:MAG: laminin B domain-containing protein [Verrucomicrobiota bacterium]
MASVIQTFDVASSITGYGKAPGSDPASIINWNGSSGNPDGTLIYVEAATGGLDRLSLASEFLGDRSAYFAGSFSYDFYFSPGSLPLSGNVRDNDIEFVGGGITLRYDLLPPSAPDTWFNRTVVLSQADNWIDSNTGLDATNGQIQTVLANLTAIYLIADYSGTSNPDTTRFDNISLVAVPESSSYAALGELPYSV